MPRPSISKRKTERFAVRVNSDDKRRIERAAALSGQSVSSFVVGNARDAAEKTLELRDQICLNPEDSKRFVEALLARPRKAPKNVMKAIKDYQRTVIEL